MKLLTILGARPQFIKAGSVSREVIRQKKLGVDLEEIIVHTGQHYDANMSDIFFDEMQIPKPDYFLGIGGIGMSSLAFYFINKNKYVAGYDKVNSSITKSLSNKGAKVHYNDDVVNIPPEFLNHLETLIVYTPAIPKSNKEFKFFNLSFIKM